VGVGNACRQRSCPFKPIKTKDSWGGSRSSLSKDESAILSIKTIQTHQEKEKKGQDSAGGSHSVLKEGNSKKRGGEKRWGSNKKKTMERKGCKSFGGSCVFCLVQAIETEKKSVILERGEPRKRNIFAEGGIE